MIKVDFHIHTKPAAHERQFDFCLNKLTEYVQSARLDCIAITNHNLFFREQFDEITSALSIPVFPGIEIDLEGSQVLVIGDGVDLDDFEQKCLRVEVECKISGRISVENLLDYFDDLSQYIVIPHYDKKPAIRPETLKKLYPHVTAGEVSSVKKFVYCYKNPEKLVPVYFSDSRIEEKLDRLPVRQTYIDCGEISFQAIKSCLRDKKKVALSPKDGNKLFQVFENGQMLSTGLNVVIGERSSGKSHTLEAINQSFHNVCHIRQFALVARDEQDDQRRFDERLATKSSRFSKDYLTELQGVVDEVVEIDLKEDERKASQYIESLLRYAQETEKHDVFSKSKLFNEQLFSISDDSGLKKLIDSTKNLIRNEEFRATIDKHIPMQGLRSLYVELLNMALDRQELRSKQKWVNDLMRQVKEQLKVKSSAPSIAAFDPYKTLLNINKVEKFNQVVRLARRPRRKVSEYRRGFEIVAEVGEFKRVMEMHRFSKSKIAFSNVFDHYGDPYSFLKALKGLDGQIPSTDFFKYFVCINFKIVNRDGFEASGGERSEFYLLERIEDAREYDMLLIDEPESSFDNLFLKHDVNDLIKNISGFMPVVLVTHNSTVGASIKPDYLVCTRKEIHAGKVEWRIYSGYPTDRELKSTDGKQIKTLDALMDCLEAGSPAYQERRRSYADLES